MTEETELALDKMKLFPDGTPMLCARPDNPELALQIVKEAVGKSEAEWEKAQERINEECGPYTFIGYIERDPTFTGPLAKHRARQHKKACVVDATGKPIGNMEPGDSIVDTSFFAGAERPS